ncbi:hypothetical protein QCB45_00450 [Thiomicrorhabdus sp. ZW0627]|uniref:hypothetical protein n=1 Tax=Thiomicrorhabdus sp. ZW0627 TaxID=3039774 RepID=UPI002436E4F0|nr:hypothetical protein [Thiomicrorhabdus sp. ZW0627]MDG6772795.1 hypothetical protein [Thiomicrorhabdus sp. ZW0627]
MKVVFAELANSGMVQGEALAETLKNSIESHLSELQSEFVQDMSHISQAASFAGNMTVDDVVYLKDNLYRCDYSYDWQIAWTCSGTQESGRVKEKVRFTVDDNGELHFKFLKLDI